MTSKDSPFHPGEVALQASVGVADRMASIGSAVIRDHMPDQHRTFYQQLPFMVVGTVDDSGDPWASLVTGQPGFVSSPDPRQLNVTARCSEYDPAWAGLSDGSAIGLLGIELETRRRNRMNGSITRTEDGFTVSVTHSFGNCPQYIQRRQLTHVTPTEEITPERSSELSAEARAWIARADTFFVASYVDLPDGRQVDASHRGGKPGFIDVSDTSVLTIPDFSGNRFFNTLGNLRLNPRAGLLFVDFATGDTLQLTGTTELVLEGPEIDAFDGAQRLWRFRPSLMVLRRGALPLRSE